MKEQLLNKVEIIVVKGDIAHYEQFLLLPQCILKVICCIGVGKRLFEENGYRR